MGPNPKVDEMLVITKAVLASWGPYLLWVVWSYSHLMQLVRSLAQRRLVPSRSPYDGRGCIL